MLAVIVIRQPRNVIDERTYVVANPCVVTVFGGRRIVDPDRSEILGWTGTDFGGRQRLFGDMLAKGLELMTEAEYLQPPPARCFWGY